MFFRVHPGITAPLLPHIRRLFDWTYTGGVLELYWRGGGGLESGF